MSWYWNPLGVLGLLVASTAATLSVIVLLARPDRFQNRILAVLLAIEAFMFVGGGGLLYLTTDATIGAGVQAVSYVAGSTSPFIYLIFLSTLPTRLVAPLRSFWVRAGLGLAAMAAAIHILLRMDLVFTGFEETPWSRLEATGGPYLNLLLSWPLMLASALGLLVAIHLWRTAPAGSPARRQGALYAVAFGCRDLGWVGFVVVGFLLPDPPLAAVTVLHYAFPTLTLAFGVLLAYGILKAQLFDIDIKIKWTLKRSSLLALLAATFFVAKETAEAVLPVEGILPSVLAAALIGLLAVPFWRLAGRMADYLLPHTQDTAQYRAMRRREVYRATLEEALRDGALTPKDRAVLAALRGQLGLTARDAMTMERDARRAAGPTRGEAPW